MRKGAIAIQFGANELSFVDLTMAKYAIWHISNNVLKNY